MHIRILFMFFFMLGSVFSAMCMQHTTRSLSKSVSPHAVTSVTVPSAAMRLNHRPSIVSESDELNRPPKKKHNVARRRNNAMLRHDKAIAKLIVENKKLSDDLHRQNNEIHELNKNQVGGFISVFFIGIAVMLQSIDHG